MRILTANEMREVDRAAIDELEIPGMVLMENAALGVVDALAAAYPEASSAAIFCGPGNNGGDGLAIGRHLAARGYQVWLGLASGDRDLDGDAARQLRICRRAGLSPDPLDDEAQIETALERAGRADLVIDALFGTGLTRPLEGLFARLVEGLDRLSPPLVAVDLPSGLDASREDPIGPHVHADLSVTFAAPKIAHVFPPAALAVGEVVVADLGFPAAFVERAAGDLWLLEGTEVAAALPERAPAAHKGDFGHALIVGGSAGKSGAVVLAGRGALRAGAGLVTLAAPEAIVPILEVASAETMSVALPTTAAGGLAAGAETAIATALEDKAAWALGPGLGQAPGTTEVARQAIHLSDAPLVVDADGLNAFAGSIEAFSERRGDTVLTPHVGELARLLGVENREIVADRLGSARRAARAADSLVVLKGRPTLIADPHGGVSINPTGNPGMATAGTGDVLTGLLCGFLAQGTDVFAATQLGVYLHGLAGDLAAAEVGTTSLVAGDLLDRVGPAIRHLDGGRDS